MKQNNLSIIEKLKDVLTRNYSTLQIEVDEMPRFDYSFLTFKMHSGFRSSDLSNIFWYFGVDWRLHVKEWSVECNNNITVQVRIWLYKNVKCENDKHDFKVRTDWGENISICNKCGLFKRD